MGFDLWNNWFLMALFTAAAWALSCVIDVCFVGDRIYKRPSDGPIIFGLFCVVPVLFLDTSTWRDTPPGTIAIAASASACYLLHAYFYFKALFSLNDASNAEVFNTLTVLFVPVIAFVLLGERLASNHYLAIGLAVTGILVLIGSQFARMKGRVIAYLTVSMLFASLAMVLQAWVFQDVDYSTGISLFSMTAFLIAVVVIVLQPERGRRIVQVCWRFGGVFIGVELMELSAVLASQRATKMSPSVSLVALVECTLPLFMIAFSWGIGSASRYWSSITADMQAALALQTTAVPAKLLSLVLISGGILLIGPA